MKQLLKILHRLSYLFVIPIFVIFSLFYAAVRFLYIILYWILTGKSLVGIEDTIMNTITKWMNTYYPSLIAQIYNKTEK